MLLVLSILNWAFIKIKVLKFLIALILFIVVEMKRRNNTTTKLEIVAEFISVLVLVAMLLYTILGIVLNFLM